MHGDDATCVSYQDFAAFRQTHPPPAPVEQFSFKLLLQPSHGNTDSCLSLAKSASRSREAAGVHNCNKGS
jgi:hypothetical protein